MSKVIDQETLVKLEKIRKPLLKWAIWTLIAGVVMGIITILIGDTDGLGDIAWRIMLTIFLIAAAMLVTSLTLRLLLESDRPLAQAVTSLGIITGVLCAGLWTLAIWAWEPLFYETDAERCAEYSGYTSSSRYKDNTPCPYKEETPLWQISMIITYLALFGLSSGAVLSIYEGKRKDLIWPLEIVAVAAAAYICLFGCLSILIEDVVESSKLWELVGFAVSIWLLVVFVALILSHVEKRKLRLASEKGLPASTSAAASTSAQLASEAEQPTQQPQLISQPMPQTPPAPPTLAPQSQVSQTPQTLQMSQTPPAQPTVVPAAPPTPVDLVPPVRPKSDEELRAEIEEQVRRELIEKEVRARVEKEMEQARQKTENEAAEGKKEGE